MLNKLKTVFIKYAYLFRLILTVYSILALSFGLIGFIIIGYAQKEIQNRNESYYDEIAYQFSNYFDEQISVLRRNALSISLNHDISRKTVESSGWGPIQISKYTLPDYLNSIPFINMLGIYYKNSYYVLTSGYKYDISQFSNRYTGNSTILDNEFVQFIALNNKNTVYFSNFSEFEYKDACLFVGFPVTMIGNILPVNDTLIFYGLSYDSFSAFFKRYNDAGIGPFMILNSSDELIYSSGILNDLLSAPSMPPFLKNNEQTMLECNVNGRVFNVYKWHNDTNDFNFLFMVKQETVYDRIAYFYSYIRNILILTLGLLSLVMMLSIYFIYRPILDLKKKIEKNGEITHPATELDFIEQTYNRLSEKNRDMSNVMNEQRMMLNDYIFHKLLVGKSLDEGEIKYVKSFLEGYRYFVLTAFKIDITNQQKNEIITNIFHRMNASIYILDLPVEKYTVFICSLPNEADSDDLPKKLEDMLCLYDKEATMAIGDIIDNIYKLQRSYLGSVAKLEQNNRYNMFNEILSLIYNDETTEKTLFYDILSFEQYIKNADRDNALSILNKIHEQLHKVSSVLIERYICYEILNVYIKALKQFKISLNNQEAKALFSFDTFDDFLTLISDSINSVCDDISKKVEANVEQYRKDIIGYVNDQFTNPDLSLTSVADHFNISIYTLSRIFKDSVGIGFKEHIVIKRIEMSKHLLLTTDFSVKEIAARVGFSNAIYFAKIFKTICGISPSKFK